MTDRLRLWFAGRSLREKRLIVVMLALLIITVAWGLVIRPVSDALADARMRHANAVLLLGSTAARADAVRAARRVGIADRGPLDVAIRQRADAAGLALATLDPGTNGAVRVAITSVKGGALASWLADLEASGILVDQLATSDNGDRTVSAQITLRGRGR